MTTHQFIDQIKEVGLKVTTPRKKLTQVLLLFDRPFTADDVLAQVIIKGGHLHRATIYRDLHIFVAKGLLKELTFQGAMAQYYELQSGIHHHHFVCQKCFVIADVVSKEVEKALAKYERELESQGLKVTHHHLKFYGLCTPCQKSKLKQ